jgi:hypothetical protein
MGTITKGLLPYQRQLVQVEIQIPFPKEREINVSPQKVAGWG